MHNHYDYLHIQQKDQLHGQKGAVVQGLETEVLTDGDLDQAGPGMILCEAEFEAIVVDATADLADPPRILIRNRVLEEIEKEDNSNTEQDLPVRLSQ